MYLTPTESSYVMKGSRQGKQTFYLTFKQNSPAKNGWIEVYSDSYDNAFDLAFRVYGQECNHLYSKKDWKPSCLWAGKIGELI